MLAYLVTGQTYPNRRALRAAGAVWRAESRGYLLPLDHVSRFAALVESGALVIAETEAPDDAFAPLEGEALREHREARRERRATRLIARAEAAERRAETARARISPAERDFLALGEPVKVGHHSERRHQRLIARADQAFMDTGRELDAAQRLRARRVIGAGQDCRRRRARARSAARRKSRRDFTGRSCQTPDLWRWRRETRQRQNIHRRLYARLRDGLR
ncbi:MAG: DUF3560 domain-containing protein [Methylocystis sp.]